MLHKKRSNSTSQWKFSIILPLLIGFIFVFNIKTVAQQKEHVVVVEKKIFTFHLQLDHTSTKKDLAGITTQFDKKDISVKFKGIKRNRKDEIIAIKINAKTKDGKKSTSYAVNGQESIKPIQITFSNISDNLTITPVTFDNAIVVGYANEEDSNSLNLLQDKKITFNKNKLTNTKSQWTTSVGVNNNSLNEKESTNSKESGWEVKDERNNVFYFTRDTLYVNEKPNLLATIKKQNEKEPLYIVDGKEITANEFESIDKHNIYSISVVKNESVITKFGQQASNGVIYVKLKNENSKNPAIKVMNTESFTVGNKNNQSTKATIKATGTNIKKNLIILSDADKQLMILDGKEITQKELLALEPNTIKHISVLKGEKAMEKYGEKASNGVVEIILKKRK